MKRETSTDLEVRRKVPSPIRDKMLALLHAHDVNWTEKRGWLWFLVSEFTIWGNPIVMADLLTKMDAVEMDYASGDAW